MTDAPVVFLHGTNGGPWTMENFSRYFEAQGYACHAPAYRFHDMPPSEARDAVLKGLSIADYVDDLSAFIETLDQPPVLVGHSLGGLVAQLLAAKGLARSAVLLNSSIINGTLPTTERERRLGKLFISAGAFWEETPGQDFDLLADFGLNTLPETLQHQLYDRLDTESGRVLFEFVFWMYDENQTTKVDIDAVTCPLLFLSGSEDRAVPPSTARAMAARYGDRAQFAEIEGACHYMQFDDGWEKTAQHCIDWLKGL
ncbi:alpha/beta hydrolase [Ruegeria hyattellae]|uniref:alpha/beta hydrolase n=1 Tax=Ruegeria hyattellae TaxID=3233337 RepID=UPI00355B44F8